MVCSGTFWRNLVTTSSSDAKVIIPLCAENPAAHHRHKAIFLPKLFNGPLKTNDP